MNCEIVELRLSDLLDGQLPATEEASVETHMASCDACRRLHQHMAAVVEWGRRFPVFTPPEWLVTRILANTPRQEKETWLDTLGAIGRWVLEPRTAMSVFTATIVMSWMLNIAGVSPSVADLRNPSVIYSKAGDLVNGAYDGAVRLYYRTPVVTAIQSRIERLRESS